MSINFTTQSESVPVVDATRLATGCPLIFTDDVRTVDVKQSTSGRPRGFALIVHKPERPGQPVVVADRLNRTRSKRHWFRGVENILFESRLDRAGRIEAELESTAEI